jgi:hypothetical protein
MPNLLPITQRQKPFNILVFMEAKVLEMRDLGFYVVIRFGNKLFPVAFTAHDTIAQ